MRTKIAQKPDIGQIIQPFGIIDHNGIGRTIAKGQVFFKHSADALLVILDILV